VAHRIQLVREAGVPVVLTVVPVEVVMEVLVDAAVLVAHSDS
jgi:hypothetical protein